MIKMTPTDIKNNKLIACKFFDLVREGNAEKICDLITFDWRMHIGLSSFEIPTGPEGMRKLFETFGD